ncbi:uncharacterized protein LOC129589992 [Paramacrobiotus metropolitanus]|uniref:uncharacterized protein LOC129589992 n=1 Tax=Paramacrobiotus metropolitanus TaxID=2943436 RepID=UPI002445A263|nr:uncharacterized protein LOC129589992 [Paramacrobiotus metropolitanus]
MLRRCVTTYVLAILVILSVIAHPADSARSARQTCSTHPAVATRQGGDDPTQKAGTWYGYRQNGDVTINQQVTITNLGTTVEPLTNLTAVQQYQQSTWTTTTNSTCQNDYWTGIYVVNGMEIANGATTSDGYSVNHLKGNSVLYHDYQKLIVEYGCKIPKKDGTCDTPLFWAKTRTRPDKLSASDKAAFDSIITTALQPYCITLAMMPLQLYDDSKPTCPYLDPPSCFASVLQGNNATVPANFNAGQTATSTASSCKWPIYVAPKLTYDPQTVAGLWYVYRAVYLPEPTSVGMQYFWHILGSSLLPETNYTGNYAWAEYTQYNDPSDTYCNYGYWTGMLVTTGQNVGFRFVTTDAGDSVLPLRSMTIYQDDKYEFFYGCSTPDLQMQTCASPFAMISARTDPSTWSQSEKDHVDNDIITPLIQSYGCAAKDMRLMPSVGSKPACALKGASSCLNQFIAGYNELLPQKQSSY